MKLPDTLIAIAAAGAILALGIQIGRDVERTSAVRAVCEMQRALDTPGRRPPPGSRVSAAGMSRGSGQLAECPAVKVITKPAAWNRVYGPSAKRMAQSAERGEDLRVPERVGWIRP